VALSEDGKNLVITWNTDAGKENSVTTIPLSGLVDVYTGVDGTTVKVDVSSDNKIGAEVKAGTITTSHIAANAGIVKTQLNEEVQASLTKADTAVQPGDITDLRTDSHTHDNKALLDTYDQTNADITEAVAKKHSHDFDDKDVQEAISKKHEHTNADIINAINEGDITAWNAAEKNAKDYADGLAGNYATAAQGGKADTAVQTVAGASGSGLKATKTGTAVTIDFDDAITFVFNCGTSAEVE
jgi:hypothetical protein